MARRNRRRHHRHYGSHRSDSGVTYLLAGGLVVGAIILCAKWIAGDSQPVASVLPDGSLLVPLPGGQQAHISANSNPALVGSKLINPIVEGG